MSPAVLVALAAPAHADPMPGFVHTKSQMRDFDCERLAQRDGADRYPGRIVASESRAADPDRVVVVCTERLLRTGLRSPRDEAVLGGLAPTADGIAASAAAADPALAERTWLVEVYYPGGEVSGKLGFAVKNALMSEGLSVSDRAPALGADDVAILTRLAPLEAYPAACRRYAATGTLGADDVLVGVVALDPRETVLHAGVCVDGGWTWLR